MPGPAGASRLHRNGASRVCLASGPATNIWIAAAVVALAVVVRRLPASARRQTVAVTQVPFSDLLRDLDRGAVSEVVVNGDTLDFKLTDGRRCSGPSRRRTT